MAVACAGIPHVSTAIKKPDAPTSNTSNIKAEIKPNAIKKVGVTEFLSYADDYANLPAEVQKQEFTTTNQALLIEPNDVFLRIKLIIIHGLPSSSLFDGAKAQNLLQQLIQENSLSNADLAFANLLFEYLTATNKANKNIKDDQKRIDSILQKNEVLQIKLEGTQQKLEAAQQKLNELKNIEKSMSERELTPRK